MSKVEEFIKSKIRIGSNTTNGWRRKGVFIPSYSLPWLSPDDARKAVEIAREEVIEKVVEFLSKEENIPLWDDRCGNFGCDNLLLIKNLKQAMKDE